MLAGHEESDPKRRSGKAMSQHLQRNVEFSRIVEEDGHHVGDLSVAKRSSVLISLSGERSQHVVLVLYIHPRPGNSSAAEARSATTDAERKGKQTDLSKTLPPALDDPNVEVRHLLVGLVPVPVARQRQIREHEVQRREPLVQRLVLVRERLVQRSSDLLAL
jgi:hypothetical protein